VLLVEKKLVGAKGAGNSRRELAISEYIESKWACPDPDKPSSHEQWWVYSVPEDTDVDKVMLMYRGEVAKLAGVPTAGDAK